MTIVNLENLTQEEFVQNYLQYRWLDETRSKLVDRFYIMTVVAFGARFQIVNSSNENYCWLVALYVSFLIFSFCFTKSIIVYRRQQRGHQKYISSIRALLIKSMKNLDKDNEFLHQLGYYEEFLNGKKVFTTQFIELTIIFITSITPLLFFIDIKNIPGIDKSLIGTICVLIFFIIVISLIKTWKIYNSNDEINFKQD